MAKNSKKRRQQLERMHRFDPRCRFCGVETVLPSWVPGGRSGRLKRVPDNMATIEHLDSRLSGERGKHPNEFRRTLACRRCNHERNAAEMKNLGATEWGRRSHNPGRPTKANQGSAL